MKLIKKIAAIMFAFMMVVSMSCNVKAVEGATPTTGETGKITINNAIPGQTYKIYKILELESYNPTTGNYAYKVTPEWKSFVDGDGNAYLTRVDNTDYVNWVGDSTNDGANVKEFAKKAIAYVKQNSNTINPLKSQDAPAASTGKTTSTVTFDSLPLGYYLVDSSVGTLCSLDTTKSTATIQEKNDVPSVEKKVYNGTGYADSNNANIGDTISFQTTINVKKGATNYILHDKMSKGLTYDKSANTTVHALGLDEVMWAQASQPKLDVDYEIKKDNLGDDCSFHIEFKNSFLEKHADEEYLIHIAYNAILNENAVIAGEGNKNETWLKYGEKIDLETTHPTTTTKTFKMDVFKYTENRTDKTKKDGLAGAVFTLKKDGETNTINFVNETTDEINGDIYRVANTGDANITTNKSGKFTIKGLSAGTYYLTETKQPAGYNKLSGPVKVEIDTNGNVTVGNDTNPVDEVKVENKSGTVLPSTGGAGTTMIYLVGAVLVLGSGVVLATKRRVKNK